MKLVQALSAILCMAICTPACGMPPRLDGGGPRMMRRVPITRIQMRHIYRPPWFVRTFRRPRGLVRSAGLANFCGLMQ